MKTFLLSIVFGLMAFLRLQSSSAQTVLFSIQDTAFYSFDVDPLEQFYFRFPDGKVVKKNQKGDSVFAGNQSKKWGELKEIDVSDPLRIIFFYKNYGYLVLTDKYFSPLSTIRLRTPHILSASAVARSADHQIWLFDDQEFRLKKLDDKGELILQTEDLRTLLGEAPDIQQIAASDRYVYLYDQQTGFYIFDIFGKAVQKMQMKGLLDFTVHKNKLYAVDSSKLYVFSGTPPFPGEYPLPFAPGETMKPKLLYPYLYVVDNKKDLVRYSLIQIAKKD